MPPSQAGRRRFESDRPLFKTQCCKDFNKKLCSGKCSGRCSNPCSGSVRRWVPSEATDPYTVATCTKQWGHISFLSSRIPFRRRSRLRAGYGATERSQPPSPKLDIGHGLANAFPPIFTLPASRCSRSMNEAPRLTFGQRDRRDGFLVGSQFPGDDLSCRRCSRTSTNQTPPTPRMAQHLPDSSPAEPLSL